MLAKTSARSEDQARWDQLTRMRDLSHAAAAHSWHLDERKRVPTVPGGLRLITSLLRSASWGCHDY
eukprot:1447105-Amphidinium_carterae.3